MIKLEHVTTDRLVLPNSDISKAQVVDIMSFFRRNNIEDCQALKDILESDKKVVGREVLETRLQQVETRIAGLNERGVEPRIFLTNNYAGHNINAASLKITERKTKGGVLIYKSPDVCSTGKRGRVSEYNIHTLKHLLSHITQEGENAFLHSFRNCANASAERLVTSLNFFEDQVIRQSSETSKEGVNLFTIDGAEKRAIVEEDIRDIIEYFTDTADICVWGELTLPQKRLLAESVHSKNTSKHQIVRENMIDVVSNYTTLPELESGIKPKTLERFIVRK